MLGKHSRRSLSILFLLLLTCTCIFGSVSLVHAEDLDTINGSDSSEVTQNSSSAEEKTDKMDDGADAIAGYLRGRSGVTSEDMEKGSALTKPITKIIGNIVGIIMVLTVSLIGLVTALDLLYIAVPITRGFLNPQNQVAGGIGGMSMGGFGGRGMGMGGMGMGMGMGGMGMGGAGAQPAADPTAKKWVSDEAVTALMLSLPQQPQGGGMGGMGMGMGMGMPQPNQAPAGGKSAIFTYFKKRAFFLILFTIASVLLMSSIFTDCGLNMAQLLYKLLATFNGGISDVDIG